MKKTRFLVCTLIFALLLAMLASCGAGSMKNDAVADDSYYAPEFDKSESSLGFADMEKPSYGVNDATTQTGKYDEKIIKTVSMSAQTKEFDRAINEIRAAVVVAGGFEESVKVDGRSYHASDYYCRTARLVVRVPSAELDDFLGKVGKLVNVTSENASVSNVTTQYYDMQSRISVLESEKVAYEQMLEKSTDVKYLLEIRQRLYDVIEEIESYKTQLAVLDSKVAYSTVTISLEEVVEYVSVTPTKATFGERIGNAFKDSWKDFAAGFENLVVWFVGAIPTLLVLAAIGSGVVGLLLLSGKKAKARAEQRRQSKDNE